MRTRVLLIEDDRRLVDVISQELRLLGYDVTVAQNGREGIKKAEEGSADLIVIDIRLPRMDGLRTVAQIRKNPKTKSILILGISGMTRPGDEQKCLDAGCDGYLVKPFTHRELGAAITTLLNEMNS